MTDTHLAKRKHQNAQADVRSRSSGTRSHKTRSAHGCVPCSREALADSAWVVRGDSSEYARQTPEWWKANCDNDVGRGEFRWNYEGSKVGVKERERI